MAERFHLGPGPLAYARTLGFDIRAGQHQSLSLEPRAYYALFAEAEPEAAAIYGAVITHFGFETLDPPLLIGLCSEDLTAAARRIALYKPLVGPLGLDVDATTDGLHLAVRWPDVPPAPSLLVAVEAMFWVALARKGPAEPQVPLALTLPAAPPAPRAFEAAAGVRITHGERLAITFSRKAARAPFAARRDDLVAVLERSLGIVAADRNFTSSLRRALTAALPAGRGTISAVAADLGTSPRSLQRRLTEAGTSFRQELAAVRAGLDAQLVAARGHSAAEAAFLLGFQDVNSLYRARKHWSVTDWAGGDEKGASE